jgi:hypothetical protein
MTDDWKRKKLRHLVEGRIRVAEICIRFDDICRLDYFSDVFTSGK